MAPARMGIACAIATLWRRIKAGLTCFGNATMAFATWRVWQAGKQAWKGDEVEEAEAAAAAAVAAAVVTSGDG